MLGYFDAIVLGIVEGLTEYLPVSSTGHLTVAEKLLGLPIDDATITGYTATIQIGAIVATLLYFWPKILRLLKAFFAGLTNPRARREHDWTLALAVIAGSIPVGIVGLLGKNLIEGPLRSLYVVAAALILWSVVMVVAERRHAVQRARGIERDEGDVTVADGVKMGLAQCFSLIPGVSRSGATISAGLLSGINRVEATELSFFMAIPALTAAGLFGLKDVDLSVIPIGPMLLGIVIAFAVAYASIAWLLRFVAGNSLVAFVYYRVIAGVALLVLLFTGVMSAT